MMNKVRAAILVFVVFLCVPFVSHVFAITDNLKFISAHYIENFVPFDYNHDAKVNILDMSDDFSKAQTTSASPSPVTSATWPTLSVTPYITGFLTPVEITNAHDGSNRLFVVEQQGRVRIIKNNQLLSTPFLDIGSLVTCCGERGLLGIAFPPNFSVRKRFYVYYIDTAGNTVVARYWVSGDPDQANPTQSEIIFQVAQPYTNHKGGHIVFGPDGYLYIGLGDGGSSGDPQNRAQNKLDLLGKLLRIDPESVVTQYAVPDTNPFRFDTLANPEIWDLGLRNPWKYSFDRATGDLYIADVGQGVIEEVDYERGGMGGLNYGWNIMEGDRCYNAATCNKTRLTLPITQYTHADGCSITGGYIYRGAQYPSMQGIYYFSDYCSGTIWGLKLVSGEWQKQTLLQTNRAVSTFGEDEAGELYVNGHDNGTIYKVTATN